MTDMKRMMLKFTPDNQPKLSGFALIELLIISFFAGSAVSVGYTLMEADCSDSAICNESSNHLDGRIAEIIITKGPMTLLEKEVFSAYVQNKWLP